MTTDGRELAIALAKIYQKAIDEPWRGAPNVLTQTQSSEAYKDAWDTINNSYRSTTQAVVLEQALEPLRKAVTAFTPEFEELKTTRNAALLDFDANKRRLADLEQQKALAEAKGKHVGNSAIELDEKIDKYQTKKVTTGAKYDSLNEFSKNRVLEYKTKHDELMDSLIMSTAVCQAELFRRAADELDKVCDCMPQDRVSDIRMRVRELLQVGGTIIPNDNSRDRKGGITSKLGALFNNNVEQPLTPVSKLPAAGVNASTQPVQPVSAPPSQAPAATPLAPMVKNNTPNFAPVPVPADAPSVQTDAQRPVSRPAAPAPAAPPTPKKYPVVTALYDNEIDADDELPFNKGDTVEVLKTEEGGWWYGRCNGREGLFPVDYVNISEM